MDCRTCQPTLIDLLHGELATDAADEAHAHLQHCQGCRGALDKLAQGQRLAQPLPVLEPPQAVTARLLQLAEERAREVVAQRKAQQQQQRPSAWQALLEFLGRFAMARQVGMATIMLLIVAVGLWSLQEPRGSSPSAVGTVVSADPSGEAVPSTGVQPAEPLDLHVDLRSGRIRSKEEQRAAASPATPAAAPPVPAAVAAEQERAALGERSQASERDVSVGRARRVRAKSAAADGDELELAKKKAAYGGLRADEAVASADTERKAFPAYEAPPAPDASKAKSGPAPGGQALDDKLEGALAGSSRQRATESAATTGSGKGAAPLAQQPARSPSDHYASGLERERAGDAGGAQQSFSQAARQSTDPALQRRAQLGVARTTATARGCSAALPGYQKVVDAAPSSPEAGDALIAMARCRLQRGESELARALLQRAERIPQARRVASSLLDAAPAEAEAPSAPAKPAATKPAANSEAAAEPAP